MPESGVLDLVREVAPAYRSSGVPRSFTVHRPRGRHEYTMEHFELVAAWLARHL
jgi:hypothetical protein